MIVNMSFLWFGNDVFYLVNLRNVPTLEKKKSSPKHRRSFCVWTFSLPVKLWVSQEWNANISAPQTSWRILEMLVDQHATTTPGFQGQSTGPTYNLIKQSYTEFPAHTIRFYVNIYGSVKVLSMLNQRSSKITQVSEWGWLMPVLRKFWVKVTYPD